MATRRDTQTTETSGTDVPNRERQGGRSTEQSHTGAATTGTADRTGPTTRTDAGGGRPEQERQMSVARESGQRQRGSSVTSPRSPTTAALPDGLFAAPPGLLANAFLANPWQFMRAMQDEMDRAFASVGLAPGGVAQYGEHASGREPDRGTGRTSGAGWTPTVEVFQRGNDLVVRADLPGIKRDDVSVDVENGVLTISGERKQEHEDRREGFYRSERSYGSFHRAMALPEGIDEDRISASFADGVLEVTIPTPEQQQRRGRKVQVK